MALLLHDISLAFPLPYEELAVFLGTHRDPLTACVETNGVDPVLGDLERLDRLKVVEVIDTKNAV